MLSSKKLISSKGMTKSLVLNEGRRVQVDGKVARFVFLCRGRCRLILEIVTFYIDREEINEFQTFDINGRAVILGSNWETAPYLYCCLPLCTI